MPYYAVAKGKNAGIYNSWSDCENQVKGYSGAQFKRFETASQAQEFVESRSGGGGSSYGGGNRSYGYSDSYGSSSSSGYRSGSRSSGIEYDNEGYAQVWTDGACASNGRDGAKAGIGVWWGDNSRMNVSEPVSGRATNNRGEIQAAKRAMEQAIQSGIEKVQINTDSDFLHKSATRYMHNWKQNGWTTSSGERVKNEQDFKELDRLQSQLDVKWNRVGAHSGVRGNEMADQLAKEGASKYRN